MHRFAIIYGLTISLLLLAVLTVEADPIDFVATLSGPAENPTNASPGTGTARVTFDLAAHMLRVQVAFSGLDAPTIASHIHCCVLPPGTAMVATALPSFLGFPLGVTSGSFDNTFNTSVDATYNPAFISANGGTAASAEAILFAGMVAGQSYLNIHTTQFPGGEIRGFLAAVPEPGTLLLLTTGLAGLAQRLRRKRPVT